MSRNPLLPYGIIAVVGLFLIIIISYVGVNHREAGDGNENNESLEAMNVETIFKNQCASCHGDDLSGSDTVPALLHVGDSLSKEEITEIINNGADGMPAELVNPDQADEIAEWLLEQE